MNRPSASFGVDGGAKRFLFRLSAGDPSVCAEFFPESLKFDLSPLNDAKRCSDSSYSISILASERVPWAAIK